MSAQTSTYHQASPRTLTRPWSVFNESQISSNIEQWTCIFLVIVFLKLRSVLETYHILARTCRRWLAPNFKKSQLLLLYQVQHNTLFPRLELLLTFPFCISHWLFSIPLVSPFIRFTVSAFNMPSKIFSGYSPRAQFYGACCVDCFYGQGSFKAQSSGHRMMPRPPRVIFP